MAEALQQLGVLHDEGFADSSKNWALCCAYRYQRELGCCAVHVESSVKGGRGYRPTCRALLAGVNSNDFLPKSFDVRVDDDQSRLTLDGAVPSLL